MHKQNFIKSFANRLKLETKLTPLEISRVIDQNLVSTKHSNNIFGKLLTHSSAVSGIYGETVSDYIFKRARYTSLPCKFNGNSGFDGVYVKFDKHKKPKDIVIVEAKYSRHAFTVKPVEDFSMYTRLLRNYKSEQSLFRFDSMNNICLKNVKLKCQQLSGVWCNRVLMQMLYTDSDELKETANLILDNFNNVRRKLIITNSQGEVRTLNIDDSEFYGEVKASTNYEQITVKPKQ